MSPFNNKSPKIFFVFDEPMTAKGREETMLGVAFEDPKKGTRARYTPQGPKDSIASGEVGENSATASGYYRTLVNYISGTTEDSAAPPQQQQKPENITGEPVSYNTPCAWPKDLGVAHIYPRDGPTIAVGVEQIRENIKDAQIAGRIIKAVSWGLKYSEEQLATIQIPVLRRHTMEDPVGKIEGLLAKSEYRERIIQLFEKQNTSAKKDLFIATAIVACTGVSVQSLKKGVQEVKGQGKDPTETVPVSLEAELRHVKEEAQKGKYESEIVLCMSYHRIRYEFEPQEPVGRFNRRQAKKNEHDPDVIRYAWGNGTAIFRIDKDEAKGDAPAFFGCDDDPSSPQRVGTNDSLCENPTVDARKSGIFEDAMMEDLGAGAEESEDDDDPAPSDVKVVHVG